MLTEEKINDLMSEILFQVYKNIPWKKFKGIKNIRDVFNHRVRSASRKPTLSTFVSKLSNYFGIQTLPDEIVELIDELKMDEDKALERLYTEHIYLCALAFLKYDEFKKQKKQKKEESLYEN